MAVADLHIHSALSACAENILGPELIVREAVRKGIDMLAVTDHNTGLQTAVVARRAAADGITVLPAMELTTREEVHLLAYLPDLDALASLQKRVDAALPPLPNRDDFYGLQLLYDEHGDIVDVDQNLRQTALSLSLSELVQAVHDLGGLAVPAHVFRSAFSLTSQLGFIDASEPFDGLEVSASTRRARQLEPGDRLQSFRVICGSDAHVKEDIGRNTFELSGTPDLRRLAAWLREDGQ